jgi:DNA-binding response OmpR family regulator
VDKILVIDDDPSGAGLLIALLQLSGYQGCPLVDWQDPIADVAKERPALVIMDVRLGTHDGLDLLRQLRTHPDPGVAGMPVLMMSAEDLSAQCQEAGASGFVEKPYNTESLVRTIQEILEVRLKQDNAAGLEKMKN